MSDKSDIKIKSEEIDDKIEDEIEEIDESDESNKVK